MRGDKISNSLLTQLSNLPDGKTLQVIVALQAPVMSSPGGSSRMEKINNLKNQFKNGIESISAILGKKGGKILDEAWINQSLRAEVSREEIDSLTELKEVSIIDLPKKLSSEF